MAEVEMYTRAWCGYCARAKKLLNEKGVAFKELSLDKDRSLRGEMIDRAGGKTSVPQIFIDGRHIGGCDEMVDLDRQGKLDPLLQG